MAAPDTPTWLEPAEGVFFNHLDTTLLRKSAFSDVDRGQTADEIVACTTDEGGDWTSSAFLRTESGLQNTMASAARPGISQIMSFSGVSLPLSSAKIIKDVFIRLRGMATWPVAPGYPGNCEIRATVSYQRKRKSIFLGLMSPTKWLGGAIAVPADGLFERSIYSWLVPILGPDFTGSQLAAIGGDIRVLVATWYGLDYYATTFYAGPLQMAVRYYTANPDTQRAFQFDIDNNSDFSSLTFSTGQNDVKTDIYPMMSHNKFSGGTTYYGRVRQKDATQWSGWSPTVSFRTYPDGAARLLTDPTARVDTVFEIEAVRWFDAVKWRKTSGYTYLYDCDFNQGTELAPNVWVSDIQEEGISQGYSFVATAALAEATAKTIYFDRANNLLYVRTSDGRNPGAFKALGVGLVCSYPLGRSYVARSGQNNAHAIDGRVLNVPEITESIEDLASGIGGSPSGSLEISNHDGLFDRVLMHDDPESATAQGWYLNGRRLRARAVGDTVNGPVPYHEALDLFDGTIAWDKEALHTPGKITLNVHSRDWLARANALADLKYDPTEYPNVLDSTRGKPIQEVFGSHFRQELLVVDKVNRILRPGRSVSAVRAVYLNGTLYASTLWSYSTTTNHVTILSGGAAAWPTNQTATWTFDGDGERFEGSVVMKPGTMARMLLLRAGFLTAQINTASFTAIDVAMPYELRCVFKSEIEIRDAIRIVCKSGLFHVVARPDGVLYAVPDIPPYVYPYTPILQRGDLLSDVTAVPLLDDSAFTGRAKYWGYPTPQTADASYSAHTWRAFPFYTTGGEREVETYHATVTGARLVAEAALGVRKHVELTTWAKGWAAGLGKTAILNLAGMMTATGTYENDLFQVRRRTWHGDGTVTLTLRWIRTLTGYEYPY